MSACPLRHLDRTGPAAGSEAAASVVSRTRTRTRTRMPWVFEYEYECACACEHARERGDVVPPRCAGGGPVRGVTVATSAGTSAPALPTCHRKT
ncbi:MAG: hypothetical protein HZA54_06765 [Planctomycetes bacterium]|nr:hypothetical protein [Planctomycetota bacterium]